MKYTNEKYRRTNPQVGWSYWVVYIGTEGVGTVRTKTVYIDAIGKFLL